MMITLSALKTLKTRGKKLIYENENALAKINM